MPRLHQGRPALLRAAVLALTGAVAGTCYWPYGSGWPMWGVLAPLLWALEGASPAAGLDKHVTALTLRHC